MRYHFRPERSKWENVRDAKMPTVDDQLDKEMQSKMGVSIFGAQIVNRWVFLFHTSKMTKDETMSDDDDDGTVGLIATSSSNKHNGVGDDAVPEPFKTSKASSASSSRTKSAWANIALARQQTWKQIVSYKSTYCIGFCANCLVVFIVLLLSSAIAQFPVIYLRVAELRAGELDLVKQNKTKKQSNRSNQIKS
jgi:hypothetical protein